MKVLTLLAVLLSVSAHAVCEKEIKKERGFEVSTEEEAVFTSIYRAEKADPAKKEYWLRKSQAVPLLTFKIRYDSDNGGSEYVLILDPKSCKTLAALLINSWD